MAGTSLFRPSATNRSALFPRRRLSTAAWLVRLGELWPKVSWPKVSPLRHAPIVTRSRNSAAKVGAGRNFRNPPAKATPPSETEIKCHRWFGKSGSAYCVTPKELPPASARLHKKKEVSTSQQKTRTTPELRVMGGAARSPMRPMAATGGDTCTIKRLSSAARVMHVGRIKDP